LQRFTSSLQRGRRSPVDDDDEDEDDDEDDDDDPVLSSEEDEDGSLPLPVLLVSVLELSEDSELDSSGQLGPVVVSQITVVVSKQGLLFELEPELELELESEPEPEPVPEHDSMLEQEERLRDQLSIPSLTATSW